MKKKAVWKLVAAAVLSMVFSMQASAQSELISDYMGRPLMLTQYTDVKGSPFLYDEWKEGFVEMQSGKAFSGVKLKYDQVEDELMFLNSKGEELLFVEPVVKFELNKRHFHKGYTATDGTPPTAFYEVLVNGPVQLLKRISKKVYEEVPYSSATKVRSIIATEAYYVSVAEDASLIKIKKDKKSLLQALPGKKIELEQYVKDQLLDLRQEAHMVILMNYYNTLQ
jgi:hypothetical protein